MELGELKTLIFSTTSHLLVYLSLTWWKSLKIFIGFYVILMLTYGGKFGIKIKIVSWTKLETS